MDALSSFSAACQRAGIEAWVSTSVADRALYSSDASLYRIAPLAVARPQSVEHVAALIAAAAEAGLPITARGAGTSCAGNAVGPGVVVDLRALNRIISIDAASRTAVVEPGVVLADLNRAAAECGLRYGPDPSTATRATIGGMIGNNACGPRAMFYGRTSDTVQRVRYIDATGTLRSTDDDWTSIRSLIEANLGLVRTECGRFPRQISGYSLEHLLPERWNPGAFWAGTEGTLGITVEATVSLSPTPVATRLVALGYPSMADAADDVPALLGCDLIACEGLDDALLDVLRCRGRILPTLPAGEAFLLCEVGAGTDDEAAALAEQVLNTAHALEGFATTDPALWQIRATAAGLAAVSLEQPAHAGWEDAAVPPEQLGAYLREMNALVAQHGLHWLPYGHFGSGCVHGRIDFPLSAPDGASRYRAFIVEAAELVARYGGSMSGEHGDGRARSELLPLLYSPAMLELFAAIKHAFDPTNLLNPGVLVDPAPLDAGLRAHECASSVFALAHPEFTAHALRCTGVGACTSHQPGGSMCPSFRASGEEKDSTRGRARTLQEMIDGRLVTGGWDAPEVAEALELCLACKACRTECPTGIDMAGLKSEALEGRWRGKLRPLSHYALGWLPRWLKLARRLPRLANLTIPVVAPLVGIDSSRKFPKVAPFDKLREQKTLTLPEPSSSIPPEPSPSMLPEPVEGPTTAPTEPSSSMLPELVEGPTAASTSSASISSPEATPPIPPESSFPIPPEPSFLTLPEPVEGRPVAIWVDSFTQSFAPAAVAAMVEVLIDAGYAPQLVDDACCGLTWITTGQREGARKHLRQAIDILYPLATRGIPIVGMEPSCTAVWRSDAAELLPDDARVSDVASAIHTLAEFLLKAQWAPPRLDGHTVVAQPHCHHNAVMGWEADAALLAAAGATVIEVHGCCGMAGNFGMEKGHRAMSVAVAELELLPAIRDAGPDAILLADGFSCRTQITDLIGRDGVTLAQLLASHLPARNIRVNP